MLFFPRFRGKGSGLFEGIWGIEGFQGEGSKLFEGILGIEEFRGGSGLFEGIWALKDLGEGGGQGCSKGSGGLKGFGMFRNWSI